MKPLRSFIRHYRLVLAAILFGAMVFLTALCAAAEVSGGAVMTAVLGVLALSVMADVLGGDS